MLIPDASNGLVDLFYEGALNTELWPLALARLSDAVGGDGIALTYQHQASGAGNAVLARLDPSIAQPYFGHFATRNPIRAHNDLDAVRARGPGVGPDYLHLPRSELERSEYFNDFLVPFGINSILMVGLAVHDMNVAVINIMRPKSKAWFDTEEVSLARSLQGHLVRAFELSRRLGQARQANETIASLFARSPHGLFLLRGDGRIYFANAVAEAMIAARDGLNVEDGSLTTSIPDVKQRLASLIGNMVKEPESGGGSILLPRRSGRRPYSLIIARVGSAAESIFSNGPSIVVCVTDPDGGAQLPESRLRQLFGLTPAEMRVAGEILGGHEAKSIARALGISVNTVRVHTARIFAKTQTSRQAELVRLMMQLSGAYHG